MAGVTKDATSNIYVPSSAAEWTAVLGAAGISSGVPSHVWLCQEASGNLGDSIGSATLVKTGSPSYQQSVTGWARKAVQLPESAATGFLAASGVGPSVAGSVLWIVYAIVTAPAGNRPLVTLSDNGAGIRATMSSTPRIGFTYENVGTTNGTSNPIGSVRPFVIKHSVADSAAALYTDQEKIAPTFQSNRVDGNKGIGAPAFTAAPSHILYAAAFASTAAELSDAQVKTLLQTLGWTTAW